MSRLPVTKRILIADDDPTSLMVLRSLLVGFGHDVVDTTSGREAWETFATGRFDIVITDWMMPDMNGLDLCRAVRAAAREHYTYLMILTALSGKTRFLEGMDAGADDYLTKPLDRDELTARLRVAERVLGLQREIQTLEGLLPICSYCKRIRGEEGDWTEVERFVGSRSEAEFTHSICPTCYPTVIGEADRVAAAMQRQRP